MERLYRPVVTQKKKEKEKKRRHTQDEEAVQPNETARQPNSGQVRADAAGGSGREETGVFIRAAGFNWLRSRNLSPVCRLPADSIQSFTRWAFAAQLV